jgi:hypothetical protein
VKVERANIAITVIFLRSFFIMPPMFLEKYSAVSFAISEEYS